MQKPEPEYIDFYPEKKLAYTITTVVPTVRLEIRATERKLQERSAAFAGLETADPSIRSLVGGKSSAVVVDNARSPGPVFSFGERCRKEKEGFERYCEKERC